MGALPTKRRGRHRWVGFGYYALEQHQAAAAADGAIVTLDRKNMLAVTVFCWDCEQVYSPVSTRCEGHRADVSPN